MISKRSSTCLERKSAAATFIHRSGSCSGGTMSDFSVKRGIKKLTTAGAGGAGAGAEVDGACWTRGRAEGKLVCAAAAEKLPNWSGAGGGEGESELMSESGDPIWTNGRSGDCPRRRRLAGASESSESSPLESSDESRAAEDLDSCPGKWPRRLLRWLDSPPPPVSVPLAPVRGFAAAN
jgi:hypothetical protein